MRIILAREAKCGYFTTMTKGCGISTGRRTFLLAWILIALAVRSAAGQGVVIVGGNEPHFPREVVLRPEAVPYDLATVDWDLAKTNGPFLKEPELSRRHVFRRVLQFGKDTNNAFGLIWDLPKRKLYVDLNRNRDLTDGAAGVFVTTNKGCAQLFTNVTLPLKTAMGLSPATVDLFLYSDIEGSWAKVRLTSHSLWQARLAFEGEEWQVALLDDLFGAEGPVAAKFLLLRPWTSRTNYVLLYDASCGPVPFPDQLFWLGQAFHLERRFDTSGATPVCKLGFTPQQPTLTELRLSGEFIYYAVLRDTNGYTAVMGEPPGTVKVPRGIYAASTVWLKKGAATAWRLATPPLVVDATAPTNVVLGGPLMNSVELSRAGRSLIMDYRLKGTDGGAYRLAQTERGEPPEFTVFHGGKKVGSGRFRFG